MLVHGDIDNNVHPGNTMRVVDALIRAGKRFDMLMLPQQRHSFGDMDEYFYWRMVDYFSEHLKGKSEKSVDIPKRYRKATVCDEQTVAFCFVIRRIICLITLGTFGWHGASVSIR